MQINCFFEDLGESGVGSINDPTSHLLQRLAAGADRPLVREVGRHGRDLGAVIAGIRSVQVPQGGTTAAEESY